MKGKDYWLAFSAFPGIGPVTFHRLVAHFGSAKSAWTASEKELKEQKIPDSLLQKFVHFRKYLVPSEYGEKLRRMKISTLILSEDGYPNLLKQISNPPFVIYIRGSQEILNQNDKCFGVVGTRKITEYGRRVTDMFVKELVNSGLTIVSGLAMGVDAQAHAITVENNGLTIAVLGCGVDCCTPPSNQFLYDKILACNGAIISEFPPGQTPSKGSFPSRNRIIAGLSEALLVTEGAEDSGSLITADYAFKFQRPVFAVPGPVTSSLSRGPFKLIKQGAKLVTDPSEILSSFKIQASSFGNVQKNRNENKNASREEQKILNLLQNESVHFDDLVRFTKIKSAKLGSILSLMEVKGMIKSTDGGKYSSL